MKVNSILYPSSWCTKQKKCSETLCQTITRDEDHNMLFLMSSGKTLGHNGYSIGFFKSTWSTIWNDFSDAILHFFKYFFLSPVWVQLSLLLFGNILNYDFGDFKLISYYNVIFISAFWRFFRVGLVFGFIHSLV